MLTCVTCYIVAARGIMLVTSDLKFMKIKVQWSNRESRMKFREWLKKMMKLISKF